MTRGRTSCAALALLASLLAVSAPARAAEGRAAAPLAGLAAPAAGEVTVLGAVIVERPAPADSLRDAPAGGRHWRRLRSSPHRHDRCEYFIAFEVSGARAAFDTRDALDGYVLSHGLVLMKNLDPNWSVGGGVQLHWATGNLKLAPEVRVRRWFGREQSVEATLGWLLRDEPADYSGDYLQQVGPVASLRYSPHPHVFAQAGVARYREFTPLYVPPLLYRSGASREHSRAFAGIGFAGPGALVALGAEGVVFVALVAALSGMN